MPHLRLSLLGLFSARLDERSLHEFESDKVRALLAFLSIEASRPHRRSTLAGLLWPDSHESAARASLRNALSNLRLAIQDRQVTPHFLICNLEFIQFNISSNHWIDVHAFEEKIAIGKGEKVETDLESHMRLLKEAVELYQGNFLEGFSLRDSPAFEEWQLLKREDLMQKAISALARLTEYYEQCGDYLRACEYAQRLVNLAPWHEEAHRTLMRLFAISGQRSLALAQYEFCRRSLDQELDVQPGIETIQLYDRIRAGQYREVGDVVTRKDNLPAELSPLVGRIEELIEIDHQLADRSCRLLNLIGPGGSGKTRLALEVARRQLEHFPDGVYFIPLEPYHSVEAVITAVTHTLRIPFQKVNNPRSMLIEYLRQKNMFLILDSFEHMVAVTNLVIDILQTATGVKILATSRERINLQDEHIIPLGGLDYPGEKVTDVDHALCFDSVRLFLEGAQRLLPTYCFTDQDYEAIVAICQQVQGMPLAILLAASWCATLPVPKIAFELHRNCLDFLRTEWRDLPERQRSLQAVFEYSYSLLNENEQKIFEGLSIFQGGSNYHAALSIVQAELYHLRHLVDKTMLQRSDAGRFELHALLRQFALRKLASRPEIEYSLRNKHMRFYMATLTDLAIDLQGPHQADAVRDLLLDLPNIQAAWNWAVEHRLINFLDMALDGLCGIFQWYGRYSEGVIACQLAANCLKIGDSEEQGEVETCLLIRILAWQVYFANILGQVTDPKRNLELAFQLMENLDPAKETTRSAKAFLLQQAGFYFIEKDHPRGWGYWIEGLALYREMGWRWGEAQVLEYLAVAAPHQDAYKTSRAWLEDSLAIRRSLGDKNGVANTLNWLSLNAAQEGDFERMGRLIHESLECSQMLENPMGQADIQYIMGIRMAYMGKFSESLIAIKEAARLYSEIGGQEKRSVVLSIQGWIETNLGDYDQGRVDMEVSNEIAIRVNIPHILALNLYGLGDIQSAEGLNEQAVKSLQESICLYRQLPKRDEMGMALSFLAAVEARLGRFEQARLHLQEGTLIAAEAGSWQAKVEILANAARVIAEQGNLEWAIEHYALATRHPYLGNSRFWWDVAGKRITELSAGLSNHVREAAEQRGKLLDLDEAFDAIRFG